MKGLRILVMLALVFVVSAPLFAAPPVQQEDTSTLEYASSGGGNFCTDTWGCPACVSNMEKTKALCVKIQYKDGSCRCGSPKGVTGAGAVCGVLYGMCKMLF